MASQSQMQQLVSCLSWALAKMGGLTKYRAPFCGSPNRDYRIFGSTLGSAIWETTPCLSKALELESKARGQLQSGFQALGNGVKVGSSKSLKLLRQSVCKQAVACAA